MKVFKENCENCLLSVNSIVSPKRRKEIIKNCTENQTHFICHKASMNNEDVCCKTFYDKLGQHSQMIRIAERLGCVDFIEHKDNKKITTHKEMLNNKNE